MEFLILNTKNLLSFLCQQVHLQCSLAALLEVGIHFRNHFFVANTAFFTRPDVAAFLAAVDASDGFFTYGWGDSLVQALAVKMFAPPNAVAQVHFSFELVVYLVR